MSGVSGDAADADACRAALAEMDALIAKAGTRTLDGREVARVRAALETALRILRALNTRGLGYRAARDVESAIVAASDALSILSAVPPAA